MSLFDLFITWVMSSWSAVWHLSGTQYERRLVRKLVLWTFSVQHAQTQFGRSWATGPNKKYDLVKLRKTHFDKTDTVVALKTSFPRTLHAPFMYPIVFFIHHMLNYIRNPKVICAVALFGIPQGCLDEEWNQLLQITIKEQQDFVVSVYKIDYPVDKFITSLKSLYSKTHGELIKLSIAFSSLISFLYLYQHVPFPCIAHGTRLDNHECLHLK